MALKIWIDKYLEDGRKLASEKETLFVMRGVEALSRAIKEPKYEKARENWCVSEEFFRMPDDVQDKPYFRAYDMYETMPNYMKYETIAGKKEKYNAIFSLTKEMHHALYQEEKGLYASVYEKDKKEADLDDGFFIEDSVCFAAGLVDVMFVMAQEIFEQYKAYEKMLKKAIKGILSYYQGEDYIFLTHPDKKLSTHNPEDIGASLLVAYTILKACRMRALLPEKYQPIGEQILSACERRIEKVGNCDGFAGELALAYVQSILLKKEQGQEF